MKDDLKGQRAMGFATVLDSIIALRDAHVLPDTSTAPVTNRRLPDKSSLMKRE
ncbi:MAG: hypothetical protein ACRDP7_39855 [Trebonia sp.]